MLSLHNDGSHHNLPPHIPGVEPVHLMPKDLNGCWTFSFGQFGAKDTETRGAVMWIENGRVWGGGAFFAYEGTCVLEAGALRLNLKVNRYRADPNFQSLTGLEGDHFRMDFIADPLSRDHFEGHVGYLNGPAVRTVIRRFDRRQ